MREDAIRFGKARSLVGIITDPPEAKRRIQLPAVVVLNSGIVHRVGLNRIHVKLARELAAVGFVVMRFDFSGIGDSKVREDSLPFVKSVLSETQEAMDYLSATRGIERFILVGICSGAATALRIACDDRRVAGVVPINNRGYLHGFDEKSSAQLRSRAIIHHYWRIAFSSSFRAKNWIKAMTGKIDYRRFLRVISSRLMTTVSFDRGKVYSRGNDFPSHLELLVKRGVHLLFIHSEGDEGLDYLHVLRRHEGSKKNFSAMFRLEIISGANHTFTLLWTQKALLKLIQDWAQTTFR